MTRSVQRPSRSRDSRPAPAPPLSADAFEISRQLIELIHVAYATRSADTAPAQRSTRSGPADVLRAPSDHAVRAAIYVYQHGDRTVGELAQGLGISYGWASRVVSELEETGHVVRQPDPGDRRVVHVSLTPAAADMVERAYRWRGDAVERALARLDDDGRRTVTTFLRDVTRELADAGRERLAGGDREA